MPQFNVDEDLAAIVEKLAKPKPFENLSFNSALRRVLQDIIKPAEDDMEPLNRLLAESMALANRGPKKAPSPSAEQWISLVPELKNKKGLGSWKALCDHLKIQTGGDSARRRLKNWVKQHKPAWPEVPGIQGD